MPLTLDEAEVSRRIKPHEHPRSQPCPGLAARAEEIRPPATLTIVLATQARAGIRANTSSRRRALELATALQNRSEHLVERVCSGG
jgi:hypothetical protein